MFPDSFDWMANGVAYYDTYIGNGAGFDISHRAMLLPLFFAVLSYVHLEDFTWMYGTIFFTLTVLVAYIGLITIGRKREAPLTWLLLLTSYSVLGQSAFIGSDIAGHFFLICTLMLLFRFLQTNNLKLLIPFGFVLGMGLHTQYISVIVLPPLIIFLVLSSKIQTLEYIKLEKLYSILISKWMVFSIIAFSIGFGLFILPRLLVYHVLYEGKVAHASLVRLHWIDPLFYAWGYLVVFSWPICALCIYGAKQCIADRETRLWGAFCLAWILIITGFFSFLYTWKDSRLLIYAAFPVYYLASVGLIKLWDSITSVNNSLAWKGALLFVSLFIVYMNTSPITANPFDKNFALVPFYTLDRDQDGKISTQSNDWALPYFIQHVQEIALARQMRNAGNLDGVGFSQPLIELFKELRTTKVTSNKDSQLQMVFVATASTTDHYIIANRNTLYARSKVRIVPSILELKSELINKELIVVTTYSSAAKLQQTYMFNPALVSIGSRGKWIAVRIPKQNQQQSGLYNGSFGKQIKIIKATDFPDNLVDDISNLPDDFTAAPLGQPIEMEWTAPLEIRKLIVHLWDFDDRTYRFTVEAKTANTWQMLADFSKIDKSGVVEIPVPATYPAIDAVKLIGYANSNSLINPQNKIFHIKELEWVKSFGNQIKEIKAVESPDKLVNGISNSAADFAAAPLGQPIEIEWTSPLEIRKLVVHLWDFDGRTYRFTVETKTTNTWQMLADFSKIDKSGVVEIPVPATYPAIDAVRLIGYANSNSLINTQNKIFHIKELEWVKSFGNQLNNHRLKAGGFKLRTESPDTHRLNDALYIRINFKF
jgi:hypothetical protein